MNTNFKSEESDINRLENDWWNSMDEIEKAEIELGILQADNEQLKTTEEVM